MSNGISGIRRLTVIDEYWPGIEDRVVPFHIY